MGFEMGDGCQDMYGFECQMVVVLLIVYLKLGWIFSGEMPKISCISKLVTFTICILNFIYAFFCFDIYSLRRN